MLLLGADGFVGAHLHAAAREAGLRVVGATRRPGSELRFDLCDSGSVEEVVRRASPNLVVNMAGLASVAESWRRPAQTFEVNAIGVVNLLEAVAAHAPDAHVVCASSAEVYGAIGDEPMPLTEDHAIQPVNPYGASKAAMEVVCGQYARSRDVGVTVVRAFNQVGPGQSPRFVASDFARQVALAELSGPDTVELSVGNLAVTRDFVDVRDAARAYVAVAQQRIEGCFNLCSGRGTELKTLIDEMERATTLTITLVPSSERTRSVDTPVMVGSPERLRDATGWVPEIPLQRTVSDLLDWWRAELRQRGDFEATHGTEAPS